MKKFNHKLAPDFITNKPADDETHKFLSISIANRWVITYKLPSGNLFEHVAAIGLKSKKDVIRMYNYDRKIVRIQHIPANVFHPLLDKEFITE